MEYTKISLLPTGSLTLPEHFFCADQHDKNVRNSVPSMPFLVQYPTGPTIVIDLGMRKNCRIIQKIFALIGRSVCQLRRSQTLATGCAKENLEPIDIDAVILSHVHYGHVGTPKEFTKAQFIAGYGVRHLLEHVQFCCEIRERLSAA